MKRGTLSEHNIGFYFLILLLKGNIQGAVFEVFFLKQKALFSEKFRNEIACERATSVSAAGSAASMRLPADMRSSARAGQCHFRN